MPLPLEPRKLLRLAWLLILLAVIVGSLLPAASLPMRGLEHLHINDKVQHFSAYALLAFLPALHERRRSAILLAAAIVLLGVALEFGQLLLDAGRFFEVRDMLADAGGVLVGLAAGWPLRSTLSSALS